MPAGMAQPNSSSVDGVDDRLALIDQGFFDSHRAIGQHEVMQVVWVYEHPIDLDGLRQFHKHLGYGLSGRLIERSPLPFGRHRWVLDRGPSEIFFAQQPRPRSELGDWADERAQIPVDPEYGPGWHLSVQPLTDGSTAVAFVVSHYIIDGVGGLVAVGDAVLGNMRDLGYRPPHSRTRAQLLIDDTRGAIKSAPEVARAIGALAKLTMSSRRDKTAKSTPARTTPRQGPLTAAQLDAPYIIPGIAVLVDMDQWDARAKELGGSSTTLAAAFAVRLGAGLGRRRASDGEVTLQIVMADRTPEDTRAIGVSVTAVSLDPDSLTNDLSSARVAFKRALTALQENPPVESEFLALAPFTPKSVWVRGTEEQLNSPDVPVIYSNLGDAGMLVSRADGTQCEHAWARGTKQRTTRRQLERTGGYMQVVSCRTPAINKIYITVVAYHPGAENTKSALRDLAARCLAEFGVTGEID